MIHIDAEMMKSEDLDLVIYANDEWCNSCEQGVFIVDSDTVGHNDDTEEYYVVFLSCGHSISRRLH